MGVGDVLAKLVVRIGADISELKAGLSSGLSEVAKFSSGVDSAGNKINPAFSKLGSTFRGAGLALSAGLTAPIVAVGGLALKASMDFETAMAGVSKNVDGTAAQIENLRKSIIDMSTSMPTSAKEIANVASAAGQLGVKTADILDFTKTMVKLGVTTNMSAEEAATAMAKIANVMQLPETDVERLASVLVKLGKDGASTESQILDMASNIVGAAKTVGISAQDVLGFANAIASVGIEAQAGGTAISRVFVTLAQAAGSLAPDKEALDAIAQAQRDVRDAGDNMAMAQRGVRDAFEGVGNASRGLQTAYQGVLDAQRGVRDASEGVAAAHRNTRDATEALAASHRSMRNATESLADAQRDLTRTYRDQRQASLDARRETLSVAEAYQGLREVQAGAGSTALDLRSAQRALNEAQSAGAKEVRDAEFRLSEARSGGKDNTNAIRSAERALSEARGKDHSLEIAQAQQRLNEVQARGPRYSLDLENAQLRLAEAQTRVGKSAESQADKEQQATRARRNASEGVQDAARGERNASEGVTAARVAERNAGEALQAANRALAASGANVEAASRALRNAQEGVTDAQQRATRSADDYADAQKKLSNLMDPERLKKIAEVAGMTSEAFADFFKKDPAMATAAFIKGLGRMKAEGKDVFKVLQDLGLQDQRVERTLLNLAGAGDTLTDSLAADRAEMDKNTALNDAYAIKIGTTANQLKIANNQLTANLILLGDSLRPALLSIVKIMGPVNDAFGYMAEVFSKLPKPLQTIILGFVALVAIVGPIILFFGGIIAALSALGISFAGGTIVVGGFAAAMGGLIIAALPWIALAAAIVLAGYLIYKNWDTIKDAAKKVGKAITDAFGGVLDFFKSNWKKVASLITAPFTGPLVALATDAFGVRSALIKALRGVLDFLGKEWGKIKDLIPKPFKDLVNAADDAFGLKSKFNGALSSIKNTAGGLAKGAVDAINGELAKIKPVSGDSFFATARNRTQQPTFGPATPLPETDAGGGLGGIAEKVRKAFEDAKGAVAEGSAGLLETLKNNLNAETLGQVVGQAFGYVAFLPMTIFRTAFEALGPYVSSFFSSTLPTLITSTIPNLVQSLANLGASMIGGVINGLVNTLPSLVQTAANMGAAIIGGAISGLVNAGVTVGGVLVEIGRGWITSMVNGAMGALGLIGTFFSQTLPGWIGTSISTLINVAYGIGRGWIESMVKGAVEAGGLVITFITNFASGFAQQMEKALGFSMSGVITSMFNMGVDLVRGFLKGISEHWHEVTDWLGKAFSKLPGPLRKVLGERSPSKVFQEIGQGIVDGLAIGIQPASGLVVPAPSLAGGVPVAGLPPSMQSFISNTSPVPAGPRGGGLASATGPSGGTGGSTSALGWNTGLAIEVNGPLTVQNIGRRTDTNSALGNLAFGVQGQLQRRGVYT